MGRLFLVFSLSGGIPRSADAWLGEDKAKHFFMSAFVQSLGYGTLRAAGVRHELSLGGATLGTAAVGVGKELHDGRTKGEFSVRDLAWDAAGAGTMTILLVRAPR